MLSVVKCHQLEGVRRKERLHLNWCHGNCFGLCVPLRERGGADAKMKDPEFDSERQEVAMKWESGYARTTTHNFLRIPLHTRVEAVRPFENINS